MADVPLNAGPFNGVLDLSDPYAVPRNKLSRAVNCYLPDPKGGCSVYGRPGLSLTNAAAPLGAPGARIGQGMAWATIADGTAINFMVCGGKLYRVSAGFTVYEDVTPVGVAISPTARVYITPFSNRIYVNDGVNTPWVGDTLTATPITATKVQYSTPGVDWVAYGPAVVWQGAIGILVRKRDAEQRTSRWAWSEVDDPLTGYFQPNFDNEWDLVQNGVSPLYVLVATNQALYYVRDESIGALSGEWDNLRTTATHDAIDEATGSRAPATFKQFGNAIYFADTAGKVRRLQLGGGLTDLSLQMRRLVTATAARYPEITARTACATLVPDLNLYAAALWSPDPGNATLQFPTTLHVFHAQTGIYVGQWTFGPGIVIHDVGQLLDANGKPALVVMGGKKAATTPQDATDAGYVWVLSSLDAEEWTDNGFIPTIQCATGRLGYSDSRIIGIREATAIVQDLTSAPGADLTPASIELAPASVTLASGATRQLVPVVKNAAGQALDIPVDTWASADATIARVNRGGKVTAVVGHGRTSITASITNPPLTSAPCVVTCIGDPALPFTVDDWRLLLPEWRLFLPDWSTSYADWALRLANFGIRALAPTTGIEGQQAYDAIPPDGQPGIPSKITATGGVITDIAGYRVHTFTSNGTFQVTAGSDTIDILVVGAGAAGGGVNGSGVGTGGGGGGGVVARQRLASAGDVFAVIVGAGGLGTNGAPGASGGKSSFGTIEAAGGGGGGGVLGVRDGAAGGSGGGGASARDAPGVGGAGTVLEGHDGGAGVDGSSYQEAGGGGGGAGAAGQPGGHAATSGNGGDGLVSSISGVATTYGGGGGGGNQSGGALVHVGAGGAGGGGVGGAGVDGGAAAAHTGGGGGGTGTDIDAKNLLGGDGAYGIVIVRYPH